VSYILYLLLEWKDYNISKVWYLYDVYKVPGNFFRGKVTIRDV